MKNIRYTDKEYSMEQIIAPTYITKFAIDYPEIIYLLEDKVNLYNSRKDKTLRYRLDKIVETIKEVPNHVIKNILMVYISHLGVINHMSIDWAIWLHPVRHNKKSCCLYGYDITDAVELCTVDGLGTLYGFREYPTVVDKKECMYMELSVIRGGGDDSPSLKLM